MTNEQAFEEFKFATNQWFRHMDGSTRWKAVQFATEALQLPVGEVLHQDSITDTNTHGQPMHRPAFGYPGRGGSFVGKVWMLNRATGERARVLPGEVDDYAARGFERGGPRSK